MLVRDRDREKLRPEARNLNPVELSIGCRMGWLTGHQIAWEPDLPAQPVRRHVRCRLRLCAMPGGNR